jgi:hypothetical protein
MKRCDAIHFSRQFLPFSSGALPAFADKLACRGAHVFGHATPGEPTTRTCDVEDGRRRAGERRPDSYHRVLTACLVSRGYGAR